MYKFMLLFILIVPLVVANPFLYIDQATMHVTVETGAILSDDTSNLFATTTFLPQSTKDMWVGNIKTSAAPKTTFINEKDGVIEYQWKNVNQVNYSWDFFVQTRRRIPKVYDDEPLDLESLNRYKIESEFLDIQDSKIVKLANELKKQEDSNAKQVFKLAKWVHDNINYNLSTQNKKVTNKASHVLRAKQGVCDELSVLFIALARASGFPARYVSGIAYTESLDFPEKWGPHAWAEVFVEDKWVPFDISYSQLGWLDASHIPVKTGVNVLDSAINYNWVAPANLDPFPVKISAKMINDVRIDESKLDADMLVKRSAPLSTTPITVDFQNPTDHYMFTTVYVTKAASTTGNTRIPAMVPPRATGAVALFAVNPVDEGKTFVEVRDAHGRQTNLDTIVDSSANHVDSKSASAMAEQKIYSITHANDPVLSLDCVPDSYLISDQTNINCKLSNKGMQMVEVLLCLEDDCVDMNIPALESKEHNYSYNFVSRTPKIWARSRNVSLSTIVPFRSSINPNIDLNCVENSGLINATLLFKDQGILNDVIIMVPGVYKKEVGSINMPVNYTVEMKKSIIGKSKLDVHINFKYQDTRYELRKSCNISWTFFDWLNSLF